MEEGNTDSSPLADGQVWLVFCLRRMDSREDQLDLLAGPRADSETYTQNGQFAFSRRTGEVSV